jgi:hypothetical protein
LLHRAVLEARLQHTENPALARRLELVQRSLRAINSLTEGTGRPIQGQLIKQLVALQDVLEKWRADAQNPDKNVFEEIYEAIKLWPKVGLSDESEDGRKPNWDALTIVQVGQMGTLLNAANNVIADTLKALGLSETAEGNADAPGYYSLESLYSSHLPRIIAAEAAEDPRVRGFASTLLLRIGRLLSDERYAFIAKVPSFELGLEAFLRILFGEWPRMTPLDPWAIKGGATGTARYQATILDLSEISTDVLSVVTSLIGRIVLEFAQRCRPRAQYPILLVLEEAHRYIPAQRSEEIPFGRVNVFERIAKEGRKFGVSLCVASQRPSELSRTVVSQCGTLIAHRIVNPDDQDLIRYASPVASRDVLRQLPSLARQHAVILGEAVPAPTYVRVRDVASVPLSTDPPILDFWSIDPEPDQAATMARVAAAWGSVQSEASPATPASTSRDDESWLLSSEE